MSKVKSYLTHSVGRRKNSIARLYLEKGDGKIIVNKRKFEDYFSLASSRYIVKQPLHLLDQDGTYDLLINVKGGGTTGQAGAIRLAIARALNNLDSNLRDQLKKAGFLTRDARKVERKKYGVRGARRGFQFSKR